MLLGMATFKTVTPSPTMRLPININGGLGNAHESTAMDCLVAGCLHGLCDREYEPGEHGHHSGLTSVAFSPGGKLVATGSRDNTVRLWAVATGTAVRTLTGHKGGVTSVAFSPDGKSVARGSEDNTVWVWDVQTGKTMRTLAGLRGDVPARVFAQQ